MTFKQSKWGAIACSVIALIMLVLSGYNILTSANGKVDWIVWASSVFLIGISLAALWSASAVLKIVTVDDESVVVRLFTSGTRIEWATVTDVRLEDGQTILVGDRGERISVRRGHPAYTLITQTLLDRFPSLVVKDAGKAFRFSPIWSVMLAAMGLLLLGGGFLLLSMGDQGLWIGLGTIGASLLLAMGVGCTPKRLVIRDDEVEIHGWMRKQTARRVEVTDIRIKPLTGVDQFVVTIVRETGGPIQLHWMHPGQFRLWLALTAWKRG